MRNLLCLAILAGVACQTARADWPKLWPSSSSQKIKESKYPPPARMAILWSPAMLNEAGKTPVRGFGGRIYFYDSRNKAIAVEGQLVVYAYINKSAGDDSKVPDRKFCFTPEQFTKHFSPSEMGASYSIWLPWDAVGLPQADISLVPIFTSSSGALVMGQSSRNMLPGPNTPQTTSSIVDATLPAIQMRPSLITGDPTHRDPAVQQAAFQQQAVTQVQSALAPSAQTQPARAPGEPEIIDHGGVTTMSMTLPGTLSDRLAQAPPQFTQMQQMAAQRQDAMARQAGYSPPTLVGNASLPPASSAALQPPSGNNAPPANGAAPWTTTTVIGGAPGNSQATAWNSPAKATSPTWSPGQTPQPTRFSPPSQPALGGRSLPQVAGPPPTQPGPAEQPSYLPGSPLSAPQSSVRAP